MLNYLDIFQRLSKERIKCGGLAINFCGIPRMTCDIDLILDIKDRNLESFLRLLKRREFKPKIPVDIMDFALCNLHRISMMYLEKLPDIVMEVLV